MQEAFQKLAAYGLTDWHKIGLIDADLCFLKNPDYLFDIPLGPDQCIFTSERGAMSKKRLTNAGELFTTGVSIIQPSLHVLTLIMEGIYMSYYQPKKVSSSHTEFEVFPNDQGLLSHFISIKKLPSPIILPASFKMWNFECWLKDETGYKEKNLRYFEETGKLDTAESEEVREKKLNLSSEILTGTVGSMTGKDKGWSDRLWRKNGYWVKYWKLTHFDTSRDQFIFRWCTHGDRFKLDGAVGCLVPTYCTWLLDHQRVSPLVLPEKSFVTYKQDAKSMNDVVKDGARLSLYPCICCATLIMKQVPPCFGFYSYGLYLNFTCSDCKGLTYTPKSNNLSSISF